MFRNKEARQAQRDATKKQRAELREARQAQRDATKKQRDDVKAWMSANKANRVAALGDIYAYPDRIIKFPVLMGEPEIQPMIGVTVTVDAAGGVAYKGSLTRTAVSLGTWQKKKDTRELWVMVEGPDFFWTVNHPPQLSGQAHRFAAKVINASKQTTRKTN